MQLVRRTATLSPLRARLPQASRPVPDLAEVALTSGPATHGEVVAMRTVDPLDDSLEDIWPGLAASVAARKAAGLSTFDPGPEGPFRHPQSVLDAWAAVDAALKKPRKARMPKVEQPAKEAKAPRKPRTPKEPKAPKETKARKPRAAKVETTVVAATTAAPAASPAAERTPVREPAGRAALGQRRTAAVPLPSAAKRVVEGADIPGKVVGTVTVTGNFRASTGVAIVIDVEGQNNIARGIVVWAGPLQEQIRTLEGRSARVVVRQPSNPRFKPSVSAIVAA